MDNLILVGVGDHYRANVGPSLVAMENNNEVKLIATVDLVPTTDATTLMGRQVPHVVRMPGESLPGCLSSYRQEDPVVLLAHSHDWHARDALALLTAGFRVIVEKPYAMTTGEILLLRDALHKSPERLALAEYYLMMKAAPLLHVAGLLRSTGFYLTEKGYLQRMADEGASLEAMAGLLDRIGRPRFVYVDVLEGEGDTGRFEHRGRQFADMRVGIGVILDLAIHALAPLIALDGRLGTLPTTSNFVVKTGVCDTFLRFAGSTYRVPPEFVPETYAELAFTTSSGIPVFMAVGKYVLQNANQRRIVIVGDEGTALLDMSTCTLSLAVHDECPSILLSSPKRRDSKYRAVLRASLLKLQGVSPYNFDPSEVALHANELALRFYACAREESSTRRHYLPGASPGTILDTPLVPVANDPVADSPYTSARTYYEHQYIRMGALEDQAFKMSAGVFVLTAAVLTFASRTGGISSVPQSIVTLMAFANLAAIAYVWRVNDSAHVHGLRAKAVLQKMWPKMWAIDKLYVQRYAGRLQMRPTILISLHFLLVATAVAILWGIM